MLGAAIGYAIYPSNWGIVIGAIITFYGASEVCSPRDKHTKGEERTLVEILDINTILYWMLGPVIKTRDRIGGVALDEEDKIRFYTEAIEERVLRMSFQIEFNDRYILDDLFKISKNSLATPKNALRRHNRKHKPRLLFKRPSLTYGVMDLVARAFVDAGIDERGAAWYFHCTKLLKLSDGEAFLYIAERYEKMEYNPTAINGRIEKEGATKLQLAGDMQKLSSEQKMLAKLIGDLRKDYATKNPDVMN